MTEIQTVTGATTPERLGRTLMHEHLSIGYPGSDVDWVNPGPSRRERVERCVDRIEEMKALGITAMLDPCPADLGRDVELMAEVAQRTRFSLICATGLYKEAEGATAYWKFRMNFGSVVDAMAELFIRELTDGVGGHRDPRGHHQGGDRPRHAHAVRAGGVRGRREGVARDRGADHHPHRRGTLRRRSAGVPGRARRARAPDRDRPLVRHE